MRGKSIWTDEVKRGKWDQALFESQRVVLTESIPVGRTQRNYNLTWKAVESDRVCVCYPGNAEVVVEQLARMAYALGRVVAYTWERHGMAEYARIAGVKMIAGVGQDSEEFPTEMPTEKLTPKLLKGVREYLLLNGADLAGGAADTIAGVPRFSLAVSMNVAASITYDSYFVVRHESLPRRWNLVEGKWAEIHPFKPTEDGVKHELCSEYINAPVEDSFVFLPNVMELQVPSEDPENYIGDVEWVNKRNDDPESPDYNPDNEWGFYRVAVKAATKPLHPEYEVVIRHLR